MVFNDDPIQHNFVFCFVLFRHCVDLYNYCTYYFSDTDAV